MERQRTSSALFIYGFVLIAVLYFISGCLAARLLYSPPQNSTGSEYDEHGQSKSGVHPSVSEHSGSAYGDAPPSVPPPYFTVSNALRRNVSVVSCGRGEPYTSCLPDPRSGSKRSSPTEPVGIYHWAPSP